MTKYLAVAAGVLMLGSLTGCKLDEPEIPAEELYIRGFIKQYGLIDPTQDFSSAMQTSVTLTLREKASVVNVYARMGEDLYRVGCFAELSGTAVLPVDVSEATEELLVDVDGVRYTTVPGGSLDIKSGVQGSAASRAARADMSEQQIKNLWIDPSEWAEVTKKNGETGDNYANGSRHVIFINSLGKIVAADDEKEKDVNNGSIYENTGNSVTTYTKDNLESHYFNVATSAHIGENLIGDKTHKTTIGDNAVEGSNPGEVGNTSNGSNVRFLIKNNDDALAAYRFVFRTASKNKGHVRVVLLGQHKTDGNGDGVYIFMDSHNLEVDGAIAHKDVINTSTKEKYTEWEVRTDLMPRGYYELIIMGVDSEANFDGDQTCGNWGFMTMSRIKTAKDMRWILACEDLGTTDDFDFNDVVFSIEAVNTNTAAVDLGVIQWQVIDNDDEGTVIRPSAAPSRADDDITSTYKTQVKVTALAAGGTLPVWLHFREEESNNTGTDYLVCPASDNGKRGCLVPVGQRAAAEMAAEENGDGIANCSEWHRWFGQTSSSKQMLNTGVQSHISKTKSVTFYTKNVFTLENFCYLKFQVDGTELPYYFHDGVDLDPWAKKVLQWKWQQEHSQKVTFGFFLTVYSPTVSGSSDYISEKDPNAQKANKSHLLSKSLDGLPPQMFLIPDCNPMADLGTETRDDGWRWPCERVDITTVYPNFKEWVADARAYYGINWFMLPNSGLAAQPYQLYPRDTDGQNSLTPFTPSYDNSGSSN